jgi:hypothetical protein
VVDCLGEDLVGLFKGKIDFFFFFFLLIRYSVFIPIVFDVFS